jgi:hypothetical protein
MARRYVDIDRETKIRAACLANLPGVRRPEACARFGLSIGMLRRAMKEFVLDAIPSRRSIVLHALTDAGKVQSGPLPDLARVANYLDFVNKDASTAAQVQALIDELVDEGVLAVEGGRFRLLRAFP